MFKMRQQRVEKFIYENNPDIFSSESMVRAKLMEKTKYSVNNITTNPERNPEISLNSMAKCGNVYLFSPFNP